VEEVFLLVLGSDEAESTIGNDAFDGSSGHDGPPFLLERPMAGARSVREKATTRSSATRGGEAPP
jgi:hypothetical protein